MMWIKTISCFVCVSVFVLSSCGKAKGERANSDVILEFHFERRLPDVGIAWIPEGEEVMQSESVPVLDQVLKQFLKPILVVRPNDQLKVLNSDRFVHNVYAISEAGYELFDVGMMEPLDEELCDIKLKKNELFLIGCKIHLRMRSYLLCLTAKHYSVGEFMKNYSENAKQLVVLKDVPNAFTKLNIWIPEYDFISCDFSKETEFNVSLRKTDSEKDYGFVSIKRK